MGELWRVVCYESGTMNVENQAAKREPYAYGERTLEPWLYIFGPHSNDEDVRDRDRRKCCDDICDFMNGGARPEWLSDMERQAEDSLISLDGTRIYATGPSVDKDPPKCWWVNDESDAAKNARARLIDRLAMATRAP